MRLGYCRRSRRRIDHWTDRLRTAAHGRLAELAELFGLLGVIGFGGPAAPVALMRREVVGRGRWISEQRSARLRAGSGGRRQASCAACSFDGELMLADYAAVVTAPAPRRVLFVCTHNSARSQMAEGMLRAWGGQRFEAHSAGTEVSAVRPEAIAVMAEIGIDLGGHRSKSVDEYVGQPFNWVITVCDQARQNCPVFPGVEQTGHWSVEDPSEATGSGEERLEAFRRVRDDLRNRLHVFILAAARDDLPAPAATRVGN